MQSARISLFLRGSGSVRLLKWSKDTERIEELIGYWLLAGRGNLSNLHGDGSGDVSSKALFKRQT